MVLILDGNSNMLRKRNGKKVFSSRKYPICDCTRSNQMRESNPKAEIGPYVRTYFWVTISYNYNYFNQSFGSGLKLILIRHLEKTRSLVKQELSLILKQTRIRGLLKKMGPDPQLNLE